MHDPAERFLDAFAAPLTNVIADMPRHARIDAGGAHPADLERAFSLVSTSAAKARLERRG